MLEADRPALSWRRSKRGSRLLPVQLERLERAFEAGTPWCFCSGFDEIGGEGSAAWPAPKAYPGAQNVQGVSTIK